MLSQEESEAIEFTILEYLFNLKDLETGWRTPHEIESDLVTKHGRHLIRTLFHEMTNAKGLADARKRANGDEEYHISFAGEERFNRFLLIHQREQLQRALIQSGIATNQSVQDTNANVQNTNTRALEQGNRMNLFTAATALFALCSVIVSVIQCNKSKTDKPIPELQQINRTLQNQIRELDSLKRALRSEEFSLKPKPGSLLQK